MAGIRHNHEFSARNGMFEQLRVAGGHGEVGITPNQQDGKLIVFAYGLEDV